MTSAESTSSTAGPCTAGRRWRDGEVVELVFELDDEALGEFFAHTGNARELRVILRADGLHGAIAGEPAQHLDGELGADAAHGDQPLEEALLFAVEKAEERDLVFAHLGVNVQRGFGAERGQRRECGHGDGDVVADAGGLDDGLAGLFVDELAAQVSDHCFPIAEYPFVFATRVSVSSAWSSCALGVLAGEDEADARFAFRDGGKRDARAHHAFVEQGAARSPWPRGLRPR